MPNAHYIQTLPPSETNPLVCEGCSGTAFNLNAETREGKIETFHTVCVGCGTRGCLTTKVEVKATQEFMQFADPPPDYAEGEFKITQTTGPAK